MNLLDLDNCLRTEWWNTEAHSVKQNPCIDVPHGSVTFQGLGEIAEVESEPRAWLHNRIFDRKGLLITPFLQCFTSGTAFAVTV